MSTRNYGTTIFNESFSVSMVDKVWAKGQIVSGYDSNEVRKDRCGAWIKKSHYGKTEENGYGWEIDHIIPISKGGKDDLSNLQPLQWENNRKKSDQLNWQCKGAVSAK